MKKLKELSIFPNSLPKQKSNIPELVAKEKVHLIYIMPSIIECLSTKEGDLRKALMEILNDINKLTMSQLKKLAINDE